jgi:hypothetical protein
MKSRIERNRDRTDSAGGVAGVTCDLTTPGLSPEEEHD